MRYIIGLLIVGLVLTGCTSSYSNYVDAINKVNDRPMLSIETDGNTTFSGKIVVYERPITPERPKDVGEQISGVISSVTPLAIGLASMSAMKSIATDKPTVVTNTETQVVEPVIVEPTIVEIAK